MHALDNIELFGYSVAGILAQLYKAFPLETEISRADIEARFAIESSLLEPRVIHPGEADYELLFGRGLSLQADYTHALSDTAYLNYRPQPNSPYFYWSAEQLRSIRSSQQALAKARSIHDATLVFLVREGYLTETTVKKGIQDVSLYILTSKGFSQLNKKFENGTIQEVLERRTANALLSTLKGAGDAAAASKSVVEVVSQFFMQVAG